jgi:hypothetical protein
VTANWNITDKTIRYSVRYPTDFFVLLNNAKRVMAVGNNSRWDELRAIEFPNRVFADLAGVTRQLESGLPKLAANTESVRSITAWPWIISLNMITH